MSYRLAALLTILGFELTIAYVLDRGPYTTFAFAFGAVPIFGFVLVFFYLIRVFRELRSKDVL